MTEEETFLRLKRIPFEEVRAMYMARSKLTWNTPEELMQALDNFFRQYGWTWESYLIAKDQSVANEFKQKAKRIFRGSV